MCDHLAHKVQKKGDNLNVEVNLLNLVAVVFSAFAFGYTLGNKDFVYRLTDKILNKSDDSDDERPKGD